MASRHLSTEIARMQPGAAATYTPISGYTTIDRRFHLVPLGSARLLGDSLWIYQPERSLFLRPPPDSVVFRRGDVRTLRVTRFSPARTAFLIGGLGALGLVLGLWLSTVGGSHLS
jgi:hypothetical protein